MTSLITLGGRISVGLTLFWAVCVFVFLSRVSPGEYLEPIIIWMTFPLGAIGDIGGIFGRRGVMELNDVFSAYVVMIPNVFLLGYGMAAFCRALKNPASGSHPAKSIRGRFGAF